MLPLSVLPVRNEGRQVFLRTQFAVTSMQNYSDGPAAIETTTVANALQMRPLHAENLIGKATCIHLVSNWG